MQLEYRWQRGGERVTGSKRTFFSSVEKMRNEETEAWKTWLFLSYTEIEPGEESSHLTSNPLWFSPQEVLEMLDKKRFLLSQERFYETAGFWNGLWQSNRIQGVETCTEFQPGAQHKQVCVVYSDNTHYLVWLIGYVGINIKQWWGKDGKLVVTRLGRGLKTRSSCLLLWLSRVTKMLYFEDKELRRHVTYWSLG